jgi:hypothetical protein
MIEFSLFLTVFLAIITYKVFVGILKAIFGIFIIAFNKALESSKNKATYSELIKKTEAKK